MSEKNTPAELVTVQVDGKEVSVPKGTLIIRAAEKVGVHIPRFCDHPLLAPAAACRQCLVEVAAPDREGNVRKMPKPQPSCAVTVSPGMEIYTGATSEVAKKAQKGVMEFLLINHPMDCPVCDKGGECPLQNQAMTDGRTQSRFVDIKRTYPKPISVSAQILLDRDRCILCQRCTRFSSQIAGDAFITLQGRGGGTPGYGVHSLPGSQVGGFDGSVLGFADVDGAHAPVVANEFSGPAGEHGVSEGFAAGPMVPMQTAEDGRSFASYFSGNVIQICPVGALTSAAYRFRARPFDLVSVPGVTEHDASGSAIRVDYRRGEVVRRMAGEDMEVNEDWITDKDRFAFRWQQGAGRLAYPRLKGVDEPVSWFEAIEEAAKGLTAAKAKGVGVLVGGRATLEDAYAYAKFARVVLGTNDVDLRTRPGSTEENEFLAYAVAGKGLDVTYGDLEHAGHVLTVGLEAEDEIGSVFLRLRKGALAKTTSVSVISAYKSLGTSKMFARFIPAVPGTEAEVLGAIVDGGEGAFGAAYADLTKDGAVILVGERTASTPGALSAAVALAQRTGARLAWIPRRAGDRGALDAGAMPNLLPGGRLVADPAARVDVASVWGVDTLPEKPGRSTGEILAAAASGELGGVVLAGVELADLPAGAREALENVFTVQLEVRDTETLALADVALPVAPPAEKGGTFVNWEGRLRPFGQALTSTHLPDRAVLADLASEMGVDLGLATLEDAVNEFAQLRTWDGARGQAPQAQAAPAPIIAPGQAVLATWKQMLDLGALQSNEPHLAATARKSVALVSAATARGAGAEQQLTITGPTGSITLDLQVVDMPDGVVWVPQNSSLSQVALIGASAGDVVNISKEAAK
ncbi:NADH-quinone oxidoreductase subunit G [Arcanobacterium wilhelmae]|uniref:NADH-quinone oxidoreductase subunit G n=1 Tax=Arcanobacterium wilhelmae TaxID=1803177 RepID=A0ABT9NA33_9ACTO|nr:NADH-quinone oxidoreductase subunit G [Arcanobacterium wilhelmae]MDP9800552.1 NADH-quinone oxidoreductase subunit G [Arcanobacterium wilhelmae]WFN89968.1 NADH-quinone oxidoreductase subunit G [Arcanobacterium wilhelmae]